MKTKLPKAQKGKQVPYSWFQGPATQDNLQLPVPVKIAPKVQETNERKAAKNVENLVKYKGYTKKDAQRAVKFGTAKKDIADADMIQYRASMHPDYTEGMSAAQQQALSNDGTLRARLLRGSNMLSGSGNPLLDIPAGITSAPGRSFANLTTSAAQNYFNPNNSVFQNALNLGVDVADLFPKGVATSAIPKMERAVSQTYKINPFARKTPGASWKPISELPNASTDPEQVFYNTHWLKGHQEVPTVFTDIRNLSSKNLDRVVDFNKDLSQGKGHFNFGVYPFKKDESFLFKLDDVEGSKVINPMAAPVTDLPDLMKNIKSKNIAKVLKDVDLTGVSLPFVNNPRYNLRGSLPGRVKAGRVMNKVEGVSPEKLSFDEMENIPLEAYQKLLDDSRFLDKNNIALDLIGDNILFNPKTREFGLLDLAKKESDMSGSHVYSIKNNKLSEEDFKKNVMSKLYSGAHEQLLDMSEDELVDPNRLTRLYKDFQNKLNQIKKKGGIIVDPRGQWAHPGKPTRIPGGDITMQGVPYPVLAKANNGQTQMMYPGQEYEFPGAEYVDEYPMMGGGGYVVTRSNDRKGKTHKVTGPDGTVKYFGDSKLGQHPKDPERKKAFYARHKKNLENNPFFRAFARKTWEEGGEYMAEGGDYQGSSIVDYLATRGYSGKKSFRKELASKYGVEDYDFSAQKNLELLRRLRANDDALETYDPNFAPVPVERLEQMQHRPVSKPVQQRPRPVSATPVQTPAPVAPKQKSTGWRFDQAPVPVTQYTTNPIGFSSPYFNQPKPVVKQQPAPVKIKPAQLPKVDYDRITGKAYLKPGVEPKPVAQPVSQQTEMSETESEDPWYTKLYEHAAGLFSGLQRKVESMQEEDTRSISKPQIPAITTVQPPVKEKKQQQPTVPYGYKQLYAVPDVKNPKDSLVSFINTFDNEQGGRYYIGHKAKEVTDAGAQSKFTNAQGVAHFLRDSDILPGQKITPESWTVSKGYTYHTTSPGKTVSAAGMNEPNRYRMLYRPNPSNDGTYLARYIKNKDLTPEMEKKVKNEGWETDFTVNAQHNFSDIAWDKEGPSTGYAAASKWLPLKDGSHTYIPYKNKDGFSRFSGGSGIYLFTDPKTGKQIGVDVSGSVNTIKKVGEELIKTYGLKPEQLELAYHDMGSYSAKPKAHGDVLDYNQWLNYNNYNRGFSGAPMIIPKNKEGGEMIRRADGSYSRRGLWDNIRANKGSGKKPTKEMLEQERKIRAAEKQLGGLINNTDMYTYDNPYMMADGGEPNGGMALGQMAAVADKMNKLRQFIGADDNLDPWIAAKLAVMDHSADTIADYMMYGEGSQEEEQGLPRKKAKKGGTFSGNLYYKHGGVLPKAQFGNDCPEGYVRDAGGNCVPDTGYNSAQFDNKAGGAQTSIDAGLQMVGVDRPGSAVKGNPFAVNMTAPGAQPAAKKPIDWRQTLQSAGQLSDAFNFGLGAASVAADMLIGNPRKKRENEQRVRMSQMTDAFGFAEQRDRGDYVASGSRMGEFRPDQMVANKGMYNASFYPAFNMPRAQFGGAGVMDEDLPLPVDESQPSFTMPEMSSTGSDNTATMSDFAEVIKQKESGGNYGALPKTKTGRLASSAVGAYQFLWDQHKNWISQVTGITNKEDFRKNPQAQDAAFSYWDQTVLTPTAKKIKSELGVKDDINTIKMRIHFAGAKGAMDYYRTGKETKDAFGTTTSSYGKFKEGGEYELTEDEIKSILAAGGSVEFV